MADIEISALADSGLVQDADLFVVSRANVAKKVTGARLVVTNAAGDSAIRNNAALATGKRVLSVTAPLIGGDGGANTALFSGSTALLVRNAADNATLLTVTNGGAITTTGTLDVAGALRQGGQQVWHAGNLTPSNYAPLASPALTGAPTAPTAGGGTSTTQIATTAFVQAAIGALGGSYAALAGAAFTGGITGTTAGFSGAITQAGNQVWHAGNLTPSNYAALSGAAFGGGVSVAGRLDLAAAGGEVARLGGSSGSPFITGYNAAGSTRLGYLNFAPTVVDLGTDQSAVRLIVAGTVRALFDATGASVTGALSVTGAITQGGNQVWHAGNLTPSNYAPLAGATFTGAFGRDANFMLDLSSSNPRITFDSGDYLQYDRTANKLTLFIGSTAVASVDSAGNLKVAGGITAVTAP